MSSTTAAALRILAIVALLASIAVLPLLWVALVGGAAASFVATLGVSWGRFLRRFVPILAISLVMAAGSWWSLPRSNSDMMVLAASRAAVASFVLVAFAEKTSLTDFLIGMRTLRMPSLLVTSLMLMLRSLEILNDERKAILRSRAARGGERLGLISEWTSRAGLIGLLMSRSVDRAERVHRAMKARSWQAERG
jgi:cobalt/nickel transport system permease protein